MNNSNENNALLNNTNKHTHKFHFFPKLNSPTVPKWRIPKYGYSSIYDDSPTIYDSTTTIPSSNVNNNNDIISNSIIGSVVNILNYLIGFSILSLPYALHQSGWIGLIYLITTGFLYNYTSILLTKCQMKQSIIYQSFPDIIEIAFGNIGI
jgi:hypothetical protein